MLLVTFLIDWVIDIQLYIIYAFICIKIIRRPGGHSPHGLLPTRVQRLQNAPYNGVTYTTKFATLNGVTQLKKLP